MRKSHIGASLGTCLALRSVVVLMTQSQGVWLLRRWKPFESVRVSQVQLLRTALCLCTAHPSLFSSHGTLIIAFAVKGDSISVGFSSLEGNRETLNWSSVKLSWGTCKLGVQMQFIIAPEILVAFIVLSGGNEKIYVSQFSTDWGPICSNWTLRFYKRTTNRKQI